MKTGHTRLACPNFPVSPEYPGRVVPLLWPCNYRAPKSEAQNMFFGAAVQYDATLHFSGIFGLFGSASYVSFNTH